MERLKELRKSKKFSHQYMADRLNISKPFYWQIEKGKRRLSYDMAVKIASIFKMKPDEIFYEDFIKKIEN